MLRQLALLGCLLCLQPAFLQGQDMFPPAGGSNFAVTNSFQTGGQAPQGNAPLMHGEVIFPPNYQGPTTLQQGQGVSPSIQMLQDKQGQPPVIREAPVVRESPVIERWYQDNLFNYTWIDFGEDQGLRIHRIEMTNAWADMRAANFFSRPLEEPSHHFNAGLSFSVQWWKELPAPLPYPASPYLPPVLYDLYVDFGWRAAITSGWMIDLALSPGLSTDFRVTPPDGFRMKGHAITMFDMLPNLRGVLGIWYTNLNSMKIMPVAGFCWQPTENTRIEAVFPQPRIIQSLGCWKGNTWEMSIGGEFGNGIWAFKNPGNDPETIEYRDLRLLFGLSRNGSNGQATLQAGYVFSRELQYPSQPFYDYSPGNAWMIRLAWDF